LSDDKIEQALSKNINIIKQRNKIKNQIKEKRREKKRKDSENIIFINNVIKNVNAI